MVVCENCGAELSDDSKFCQYCGAKVANNTDSKDMGYVAVTGDDCSVNKTENTDEQTHVKSKRKFSLIKKLVLIFTAVLVVLVSSVVLLEKVNFQNDYKEKMESDYQNDYKEKIEIAYNEMTYGAKLAESYATLQSKVWYNCISEIASSETDKYTKNKKEQYYSNFNDALSSFYDGESSQYTDVYTNVILVDTYISRLKDCPNEYEEEYKAVKELYLAYSDLADLVVGSSSYSYNTFSEALESAKSNYKRALFSAKLLLE